MIACLFVVTAGLLSGCTNSDKEAARKPKDEPEAPSALISERTIAKLEADSPERALFEYWSQAQFQAWPQVLLAYSPGLTAALGGDAKVEEVLKSQADYFGTAAPRLRKTDEARPGLVSVQYSVTNSEGDTARRSMLWVRQGDEWRIAFDPFLDGALNSYEQALAQEKIDPLADEPSPSAVLAGRRASRLQSVWVERFVRQERAAGR